MIFYLYLFSVSHFCVVFCIFIRYGSFDELKVTVKKFHEVGIKVLGDVVLNHRCASERNQNGIWNIFGGRLNWDERAVVADDPHFQVCISLLIFLCCCTSKGNFLVMLVLHQKIRNNHKFREDAE